MQNAAIVRMVYSGIKHIQVYSEPSVTLTYAESWNIQSPEIFQT